MTIARWFGGMNLLLVAGVTSVGGVPDSHSHRGRQHSVVFFDR
jgi:hypothetical protein